MYQIRVPKKIASFFSQKESLLREKGLVHVINEISPQWKSAFKTLSLLIALAYLAAIIANGIFLGVFLNPQKIGQIVPREVTGVEDNTTPVNHTELRNVILARNLFNLEGKLPEESEVSASGSNSGVFDPNAPCEKTTLPLALVGTIYMGTSNSSVILRETGYSEADIYKVSDKIVGFPNASIYTIERKSIILNNDGRKECIELSPDPNRKKSMGGAALMAETGKAEQAIVGGSVTLESSWVEKELGEGFSKVLQAARLVPNISPTDGKMNGFKIFAISPGSIMTRVGLQNEDVITKVNDISMTQPDQGFAIYQAMQDEREITIHVLRNGKIPVTLNVKIK
jgi:type II secretion system protein C